MPWTTRDVDGFKKGLTRSEKRKWVRIANGVLRSCVAGGGTDSTCSGKAVRIANSKFKDVMNPVLTPTMAEALREIILSVTKHKEEVVKVEKEKFIQGNGAKVFQNRKQTPLDPVDNHVHMAAFDEDGNGGTDEAGNDWPHTHMIYNFKVQPHYERDYESGEEYASVHPGSLAFKEHGNGGGGEDMPHEVKKCIEAGGSKEDCMKKMREKHKQMSTIHEMEIFRAGTHNGDEFTEEDLEEIAENFKKLKDEVRPKLKITHHEHQKTLAGLASYGDITDVYVKPDEDGKKRLYAKIENVPDEVIDFIQNRRFPERSIEIYPEFKLGTKDNSPVYRNVLKAIALLGQEMPAVTGMAPVMLAERFERQQTICFTEQCLCEEAAQNYLTSLFNQTNIKCMEAKITVQKEVDK